MPSDSEIFEFNYKNADLQRPQVLYRVRRKRLYPMGAGEPRRISRLAAIEQNIACLIPPDEMAPTLEVSNSAPSMSVQRNYISRRYTCVKNAHPVVFQQ